MEAGGGIGRLKRRFQVKNTIFFRLIKHYSAATRSSTSATPLLTFLLTVKIIVLTGWDTNIVAD